MVKNVKYNVWVSFYGRSMHKCSNCRAGKHKYLKEKEALKKNHDTTAGPISISANIYFLASVEIFLQYLRFISAGITFTVAYSTVKKHSATFHTRTYCIQVFLVLT